MQGMKEQMTVGQRQRKSNTKEELKLCASSFCTSNLTVVQTYIYILYNLLYTNILSVLLSTAEQTRSLLFSKLFYPFLSSLHLFSPHLCPPFLSTFFFSRLLILSSSHLFCFNPPPLLSHILSLLTSPPFCSTCTISPLLSSPLIVTL